MTNLRPPDIQATLVFLTTAEGGRKTACRSSDTAYRPNCDFGIPGFFFDCFIKFLDKEWILPGETVQANAWFFLPEFQNNRLFEGFEFTVNEGRPVVARGRVTQVFNSDLLNKAFKNAI